MPETNNSEEGVSPTGSDSDQDEGADEGHDSGTFGRRVLVNPRDRKRTEQLIDDCHIFDGVHGERCNLSGMPTVTDYNCPPGCGFFDTKDGFIQIVIPSHEVER